MKLIKQIAIFLFGFIICGITMKYLSPVQSQSLILRLIKVLGLLMLGTTLGVGLMACVAAGKYEDILSGRDDENRGVKED